MKDRDFYRSSAKYWEKAARELEKENVEQSISLVKLEDLIYYTCCLVNETEKNVDSVNFRQKQYIDQLCRGLEPSFIEQVAFKWSVPVRANVWDPVGYYNRVSTIVFSAGGMALPPITSAASGSSSAPPSASSSSSSYAAVAPPGDSSTTTMSTTSGWSGQAEATQLVGQDEDEGQCFAEDRTDISASSESGPITSAGPMTTAALERTP